jgi:hypothetical protein
MARPGPATQAKRRRERAKKEKRQAKLERRAQRKELKAQLQEDAGEIPTGQDPDIMGIVPGPQESITGLTDLG